MTNLLNTYLDLLKKGEFINAGEIFFHDNYKRIIINPRSNKIIEENKEESINSAIRLQKDYEIVDGYVGTIVDEKNGIVTLESTVTVKGKDGISKSINEMVIQQWKQGKILQERIYNKLASDNSTNGINLKDEIEAYAANSNGCCTCGDSRSC
ncbi:hypothetical protein [Flavobacterium saccharophilum]|uniref:SnoaL-like domain-containing protein n=1 Tax=Flavobacterium saccharophilum TaxID=29534 RepID=A0A1M7MCM3_9FLAO|nr:hypothetical protein [Flavobacterium saccharophilum]SHM88607.1 hypothetical protein SAMN05444366_4483 [Flavobacterium saccharophilum]